MVDGMKRVINFTPNRPDWPICFFSIAEAPCKHLVELARAEVASNPRASATMRLFARVQLDNAERGVHNVLKEHGYTAPVPVDFLNLGPGVLKDFPVIKLSSWCQYLLDSGRIARQMVGVPMAKMRAVLGEYWQRFQAIRPRHGIFEMAEQGLLRLDSTLPFFSHSDEGRSYKHLPLFVLSSHGALGRGTRSYLNAKCHKAPLRRNGMGMNFIGKTWTTQFMFTTVLKTVSQEHPEIIQKLMEVYAADVRKLLTEGIRSKDGQVQLWFAHVGTKGDLPALTKLGGFKRSFANVPRGPSSKRSCKGICFQCLAGQEADPASGAIAIPYENVNQGAEWVATLNRFAPWDGPIPAILAGVPVDLEGQISFFRTDLWHNAHMGVIKHYTASSFVVIVESDLPSVPAGSIETKFTWLTKVMNDFFASCGKRPLVQEISRDTLNFASSTVCPLGKWSKGQASTEMMHFLDHFGQAYIVGKTANPLLLAIVPRLGLTKGGSNSKPFPSMVFLKLKPNV